MSGPAWDGRSQSEAVELHAEVALRPILAKRSAALFAPQSSDGSVVTSGMRRGLRFSVGLTASLGTWDPAPGPTESVPLGSETSSRRVVWYAVDPFAS